MHRRAINWGFRLVSAGMTKCVGLTFTQTSWREGKEYYLTISMYWYCLSFGKLLK